jgi:hypothetical protein
MFFNMPIQKIERPPPPTPKHPLLHHIRTAQIKMFTFEQLTKALPALEDAFRTIDDFVSVSIKQVSGPQDAVALITFGRKNPNHVPGVVDLTNPDVDYGSMYIFSNGRMVSHSMKYKGYTTTSQYAICIENWLAALVQF